MLTPFYRDMHFRIGSELIVRLTDFSAETGLSYSEIMRQALEQFLAGDARLVEPEQALVNDDPSNPLG
jgi:hypothetical protein